MFYPNNRKNVCTSDRKHGGQYSNEHMFITAQRPAAETELFGKYSNMGTHDAFDRLPRGTGRVRCVHYV